MRNEDRRKELGKMLFDVAKYLAAIGLISGMLTNKLEFFNGILFVLITFTGKITPKKALISISSPQK